MAQIRVFDVCPSCAGPQAGGLLHLAPGDTLRDSSADFDYCAVCGNYTPRKRTFRAEVTPLGCVKIGTPGLDHDGGEYAEYEFLFHRLAEVPA